MLEWIGGTSLQATMNRSFRHTFFQKIGSSRLGAMIFARILHRIDRFVFKLSGGRTTMTSALTGLPVVLLTTTGARSGLPRSLPLLSIRDECNPNTFGLIATNFGQTRHPAWYYNLKANPQAICSFNGWSETFVAHEAHGEEYERFWKQATSLYPGYLIYKQRIERRSIPILVMTPVSGAGENDIS